MGQNSNSKNNDLIGFSNNSHNGYKGMCMRRGKFLKP